jgi:hypothetical protein
VLYSFEGIKFFEILVTDPISSPAAERTGKRGLFRKGVNAFGSKRISKSDGRSFSDGCLSVENGCW